jgi:gamma-glutamyltranspeptidase
MSIAPGKPYTSLMSPKISFDGDRPHIVVGVCRMVDITLASAQAIINAADFRMTMTEDVAAPGIAVTKNKIVEVSNRTPKTSSIRLRRWITV